MYPVSRTFTHDGTEISCSEQLSNGRSIVSDGEDFIPSAGIGSHQSHDYKPSETINELPDEIIEMILEPLSTKDLLNVRLASSRCLPIATGFCQNRNVRLRKFWFQQPHAMDMFTLYVDRLPPWSSYGLDDLVYTTPEIKQKFLKELGHHLRDTQISPCLIDDNNIIDSLKWLPNLTSLKITESMISKRSRYERSHLDMSEESDHTVESAQLPKLKRVKLEMNYGNIKVLKFLNANAQLDYLNISSSGSMPVHEVAPLLVKIPSLTLKLYYAALSVLNELSQYQDVDGNRLKVHKLSIHVEESQLVETQTLLSSLSPCLGHLRLGMHIGHGGNPGTTFNSSLPVLKTLKIDFQCHSTSTSNSAKNYLETFFSVLRPAQVPLLQEFSISAEGLSEKAWLFKSREMIFQNVTKLEVVNLTYLDDNWNQHFPNVRKMTVEGHIKSFREILATMTSLEYLTLKMKRSRQSREDIVGLNAALSGLCQPERGYHQIQQYQAGELEITKWIQRLMNFRAPILRLTRLKEFDLELGPWTGRGEDNLVDSGVYFSLLRIQKLEYLRLCNVSISRDMEDKLGARHKQFVRERTYRLP